MSEIELVILTKNVSSWSLRAWLPLVHHGIPFRETLIAGDSPGARARLRASSPSGKVPALVHGDLVVHESIAILEYLAECFPEKELWPRDRAARAVARAISAEMHAGFAELRRSLPMNLAQRTAVGALDPEASRQVDRVRAIVNDARARFGEGGPFLFGAFTNADAMFAPVACRFRSYRVPLDPVTEAWTQAVLSLPAMERWTREALATVEGEWMIDGAGRLLSVRPRDFVPSGPAYAVVFVSKLRDGQDDYAAMAHRMVELARTQDGFLGVSSARGSDGVGITVSYFRSLEAIAAWRANAEHRVAQGLGRERFYEGTLLTVARVERESSFGPKEIVDLLRLV